MTYFVYILQTTDNTYYTGSTNNLKERIKRHKHNRGSKFTKGTKKLTLVYHEKCFDRASAMKREKQIKSYSQKKKRDLINKYKN
jgi:putative endonuclease